MNNNSIENCMRHAGICLPSHHLSVIQYGNLCTAKRTHTLSFSRRQTMQTMDIFSWVPEECRRLMSAPFELQATHNTKYCKLHRATQQWTLHRFSESFFILTFRRSVYIVCFGWPAESYTDQWQCWFVCVWHSIAFPNAIQFNAMLHQRRRASRKWW